MSDRSPTVFIVDDDASFLKSIERLLRSSGFVTQCYSSAVDFIAQQAPDIAGCVLADLRMPDMDGIALQAHLARSANPLPVVFLTGHGDIPTSVQAMRQGAEDFLVKTTPKEAIIAAIERALARGTRERMARAHRRALQARLDTLTPREEQVLSHVMNGSMNKEVAAVLGIDERSVNLETVVGRPLGCVPRGVWQGTTRRNSRSIPTSCNAARRCAGRASGVVAAFTPRVNLRMVETLFNPNSYD